jgi:hypothetical protein
MLPLIIARRRGRAAQFATALVVYKNSAPDVQLSLEASGAETWQVRVQVGDKAVTVELPRYGDEMSFNGAPSKPIS